jgi:hypothetical protein
MNIDINEYNKLKLINEELLIKNKELEEKLKKTRIVASKIISSII